MRWQTRLQNLLTKRTVANGNAGEASIFLGTGKFARLGLDGTLATCHAALNAFDRSVLGEVLARRLANRVLRQASTNLDCDCGNGKQRFVVILG